MLNTCYKKHGFLLKFHTSICFIHIGYKSIKTMAQKRKECVLFPVRYVRWIDKSISIYKLYNYIQLT